jgi:tRNA nucleotidyltransferase (CCA-adding enzyme)
MSKFPKKTLHSLIPEEVSNIAKTLINKGFEAYLVGGCTRDLIIGKKPKDWDITTNAKPEEIIPLFPKTFYENKFGTVGVVNETTEDLTLKVVEVTPYRLEAEYSDNRRPDSVTFSNSIEDDLKRRDFTINAIALKIESEDMETVIDLYNGQEDLKRGILRTVGNPHDRFNEDALRMLRAVRLASELSFTVEPLTEKAIKDNAHLLSKISKERIRDEFTRLLMSDKPMDGLKMAQKLGILGFIAQELPDSIGIEQNQAHSYDVWEHLLRSVQHAADKKWPLEIRLAALFHDIAKPPTRRWSNEKKEWTFYGHEVVGAKMTKRILENLRFSNKITEKVVSLVRWHMFFTDTEQITLSAVRRIITSVGKENIWDLMNLRICDRIGTGRPKENPYRLRKYKSMIEEALRDPLTVGMLAVDGNDIKTVVGEAGPKIGFILHALLEDVLENPAENTKENLIKRAVELNKLSLNELRKLGEEGRKIKEEKERESVKEIRKKYSVE